MLVVAKVLMSPIESEEGQTMLVSPLYFLPSATTTKNAAQMSAFTSFVKQLINVGVQFGVSKVVLELQNYDEEAVSALETTGFHESGGFWSPSTNCMLHQFTIQNRDAPSTGQEVDILTVEQDDDNSGMKSLMESLFAALHREQTSESVEVLSVEPVNDTNVGMTTLMEDLFAALHKDVHGTETRETTTSLDKY